jgi:small subunit ribosomal protein S21
MLIIEVKNGESIEKALKAFKLKVIKTKQSQKLNERKEFTKDSVNRRTQRLRAIYVQKKNELLD